MEVKDTQIDVNFHTNLKRIIAQIVPPSVCNMIVSFYAAIAALHQDQLKTNFKWWWIELFSQQPTLKKQKYKIGLLMINLWVETLATLTNYSSLTSISRKMWFIFRFGNKNILLATSWVKDKKLVAENKLFVTDLAPHRVSQVHQDVCQVEECQMYSEYKSKNQN